MSLLLFSSKKDLSLLNNELTGKSINSRNYKNQPDELPAIEKLFCLSTVTGPVLIVCHIGN